MALRWITTLVSLVALLLVALSVTFFAIAAGRLLMRVNDDLDEAGNVAYVAEPIADLLMDRLNESGYGEPALDPSDPLLAERTIVVTEGMNERVARRVVRELRYLASINNEDPITLYLSTPGGWLDAAFAIVDTMRSIEPPVNVSAIGGCYSAGTVVLAGATGTRTAAPGTLLSVHVNDYQDDGPFGPDELELARFSRIYRENTDIPQGWFEEPGDNHFYMDADRALELGLIEAITPRRTAEKRQRQSTAPLAAPAA